MAHNIGSSPQNIMGMTKNIMERKLTEEQVKKFKLLLIEDEKLLRGIQHCLFCA